MNNEFAWYKAHGFPYKVIGDNIFWQTRIQTLEWNAETRKIVCHDKELFDTLVNEEGE